MCQQVYLIEIFGSVFKIFKLNLEGLGTGAGAMVGIVDASILGGAGALAVGSFR